jgi:hypothetical protein
MLFNDSFSIETIQHRRKCQNLKGYEYYKERFYSYVIPVTHIME